LWVRRTPLSGVTCWHAAGGGGRPCSARTCIGQGSAAAQLVCACAAAPATEAPPPLPRAYLHVARQRELAHGAAAGQLGGVLQAAGGGLSVGSGTWARPRPRPCPRPRSRRGKIALAPPRRPALGQPGCRPCR
jgi:hypothetical protein